VLLEVAASAGVDPGALERALDDGRYESELEAASAEAERYGITGTPGLLFGRFLLIGAAPMDELRRAADRAEREAAGR
jgi:predicted DsbA family dithiol-disulfide isomerase